MIRFNKVSKVFGDTAVLHEQSFQVNDREFYVLVGSSGSGKTTLLKMINCLIDFAPGEHVVINFLNNEKQIEEPVVRAW